MRLHALLPAVLGLAVPVLCQVPDLYDMDTVRDIRLQFSQPNWWAQLTANYGPEINIAANMTVDGITYPNVGVRFRGNTSYTQLPAQPNQGWEKKSFNIEMDWMVQGQDIYGYDHLNLNNGFHDPLFLREPVTYYVMRRHGVAPKANWVRLWLNGAYWGIYINVQQPNKDMFKEWFRSNDGNRYRCFPVSGGFGNGRCCYTVLSPNTLANYLTAYQAKQGDGTDLMNMIAVLNSTTTATPQINLTRVFNVDSFYRYAVVMNVCTQTDSYLQSGKDHFLYMDEVHGDGTTLPFDLNEALAGSTSLSPTYQTTVTTRPAFTRTLQFANWTERYKAHMRAVVDHTFNPTHLVPLIQRWHAMIYNDVLADTKKVYTTAQFQQNLTTTVNINSGFGTVAVPGLIPFIQGRHGYLNSHSYLSAPRATLTNLQHTPPAPNPTQIITVTVQADGLASTVNLFWRASGPFVELAMFDDGLHGDGAANDGTWGVFLPAQAPGAVVDYYVEARTSTGAARYEPHTAELERACPRIQVGWPVTSSPIVLNEFVAQNQTGIVDENGQHEDWLELYNTSSLPVNVGGLWVSDDISRPKWQIPANTMIPGNGTLLIWCDEDGTQGPMHANFKLAASGEAVALFAADRQSIHDWLEFGQQQTDVSTARVLDGGQPWATFPVPTPYARNEQAGCGTRTYGALDPTSHGASLVLSGAPQIGTTPSFDVTGGPTPGIAAVALALLPDHVDLAPFGVPGEILLLSPLSLTVYAALPTNPQGAASVGLPIPNNGQFAGIRLYAQTVTLSGAGFDTSRALELVLCP